MVLRDSLGESGQVTEWHRPSGRHSDGAESAKHACTKHLSVQSLPERLNLGHQSLSQVFHHFPQPLQSPSPLAGTEMSGGAVDVGLDEADVVLLEEEVVDRVSEDFDDEPEVVDD